MTRLADTERYQRQILLKVFGREGQEKLLAARVLVVGAGGLGCPALQYLAAAGLGTIGIVDFDVVSISNLHRQILYSVDDIGKSKAECAASQLNAINPDIQLDIFNCQLTNRNALEIIAQYDLVIDGTDNFATRYLVNDACALLNKPLVYGAVLRFEGQVGVFNLADKLSGVKTDYRDLFPYPPDSDSFMSCNEAGVLGILTGTIGIMQASEAIKIVAGIGDVLCNQIVSYNILTNSFYKFSISQTEKSSSLFPRTEAAIMNFDYEWFCGIHQSANVISIEEFDALMSKEKITIIDVRERGELPLVTEFVCTHIPMTEFEPHYAAVFTSETIVVICQTGRRSAKAVARIKEVSTTCKLYSLAGGIIAWKLRHQ